MSLSITKTPADYSSVGNPIIYKFLRSDYAFDQINDNGGFMQLQFDGVDISSSFNVDDVLYVSSETALGNAQVTASTFSGGNTLVTLDSVYGGSSAGRVNNLTTRANYKIEIEVYNSGNTLLNESPFYFVPDSTGACTINIAPILKPNVGPRRYAPYTALSVVADSSFSLDGLTSSLIYYIKYREVWTGSAESQTSDVANQYTCIHGARQLMGVIDGGKGNTYVDYTIFSYTAKVTDFSAYTNQGTGVDWTLATALSVNLTAGQSTKKARSGSTIDFTLMATCGSLQVLGTGNTVLTSSANGTTLNIYYYNGVDSSLLATIELSEGVSLYPFETISALSGGSYNLEVELVSTTGSGDFIVSFVNLVGKFATRYARKFLTRLDEISYWPGWPLFISLIDESSEDISIKLTESAPIYFANVVDTVYVSTTGLCHINFPIAFLTDYDDDFESDEWKSVKRFTLKPELEDCHIEDKVVKVRQVCKNPIMLMGQNSLGGFLMWLFDVTQEYTFEYSNGVKAKRLVLYTTDLTLNEWEALQDFITLGQTYRNNIIELEGLDSGKPNNERQNRTQTRQGQQLYTLDEDGNFWGVIAMPTKNKTMTKMLKHSFEIEIEYPEHYLV